MLQRAVGVDEDGIIGALTIARTNTIANSNCGEYDILNKLVDQQVMQYCKIVKSDISQIVFLIGWITRAQDRGKDLS
jgi:lysozyme family protein